MSDDFHRPVLVDEVCDALAPALASARGVSVFVDGTCGGGGHALAILERCDPDVVVLIDRDQEALEHARARIGAPRRATLHFVHACFAQMREELAGRALLHAHAILVDLGVSSHQLDVAGRGFSFRHDGPLDMRMDASRGKTAAQLLEELSQAQLEHILSECGEEPDARRIAKAILLTRPRTSGQLAAVVSAAMSAAQRRALGARIHPATRTFQALRIVVNAELEQLDALLADAPQLLAPAGRLAVISFHSLEADRIKRRFRRLGRPPQLPRHLPITFDEQTKPEFTIPRGYARGIGPTPAQTQANPRSRSSRLHLLERASPP